MLVASIIARFSFDNNSAFQTHHLFHQLLLVETEAVKALLTINQGQFILLDKKMYWGVRGGFAFCKITLTATQNFLKGLFHTVKMAEVENEELLDYDEEDQTTETQAGNWAQ